MFELRQRVRLDSGRCKHLRSSSGRCFLSILRPWRNTSLRWRSACAENLLKNKQNGVEVTILIVIALFARSDFTIGGSHFRLCFGRKTWRERPRAASSRLSGSCSCNRNVRESFISTNQEPRYKQVLSWRGTPFDSSSELRTSMPSVFSDVGSVIWRPGIWSSSDVSSGATKTSKLVTSSRQVFTFTYS